LTVRKDIAERVERIAEACRAWNEEANVFVPVEITKRHRLGRGFRVAFKALIGLAIAPPIRSPGRIVLFQGLRYQYLFSQFADNEIYLLGSWAEREHARKHGYGFIPVFPVENAIRLAVYRRINLLARQQMRRWRDWIAQRDVTVVLYEDTQPMGTFLALLADPESLRYRAVCIQHGHYCRFTSPYRPEGRLTEYNLVWDTQQAEWISGSSDKTRVIGLPYHATAEAPSNGLFRVVFVGIGSISHHAMSIEFFGRIASALRTAFDKVEIYYRPHPNEFQEPTKIAECKQLFGEIDISPKVELLNGPWTLFIGEVSSLLYEAKQAGHLTAFVPIDPKNIPTGYHDITVDPNNLDAAMVTLRMTIKDPPHQPSGSATVGDPIERFVAGAVSLGLISKEERHD
jgi:hypothetical protein